MNEARWQRFRTGFAIVAGALALFGGIWRNEPAMMVVGAGLIGFSPASKGP